MSEQNDVPSGRPGGGRFQRKPLATLARISRLATTAGQEDVQLPAPAELDELISYLTLAKKVGGMTIRQMDAFWDMSRASLGARDDLRTFHRDRPAHGPCPIDDFPDKTPERWFDALNQEEQNEVLRDAFVRFKHEMTPEFDLEGEPIDYGTPSLVP